MKQVSMDDRSCGREGKPQSSTIRPSCENNRRGRTLNQKSILRKPSVKLGISEEQTSTESLTLSKKPSFSDILHRTTSNGSSSSLNRGISAQNLAQLKRQSIASLNGKPYNVNMYNDNVVLETTLLKRRSVTFDVLPNPNRSDGRMKSVDLLSFKNNIDGINADRKLGRSNFKTEYQSPSANYYSAELLETHRHRIRAKDSTLEAGLDKYRFNYSNSINSNTNISEYKSPKTSDESNSDNEIDDIEFEVDLCDMYSIDSEEDAKATINISESYTEKDLNGYHKRKNNPSARDIISVPTRIQERKLALKEGMEVSTDEERIGSEWLNLTNYKVGAIKATNIQSIKAEAKTSLSNTFVNIKIVNRNKYEQITNDLRNLMLFNHHPLLSSIQRVHSNEIFPKKENPKKFTHSRELSKITTQLWVNAIEDSRLGATFI